MAKVSISEASRLTGKPRSTIHRHINKGKLSKQKDGLGNPVLDVIELERVYGDLKKTGMKRTDAKLQAAPPQDDVMDREELAVLRKETVILREQLEDLRQDRDHWRQQATALLSDQREKAPRRSVEGFFERLIGNHTRKG